MRKSMSASAQVLHMLSPINWLQSIRYKSIPIKAIHVARKFEADSIEDNQISQDIITLASWSGCFCPSDPAAKQAASQRPVLQHQMVLLLLLLLLQSHPVAAGEGSCTFVHAVVS
jgi:hypothetical protein